jgi:hypothetical protein
MAGIREVVKPVAMTTARSLERRCAFMLACITAVCARRGIERVPQARLRLWPFLRHRIAAPADCRPVPHSKL